MSPIKEVNCLHILELERSVGVFFIYIKCSVILRVANIRSCSIEQVLCWYWFWTFLKFNLLVRRLNTYPSQYLWDAFYKSWGPLENKLIILTANFYWFKKIWLFDLDKFSNNFRVIKLTRKFMRTKSYCYN